MPHNTHAFAPAPAGNLFTIRGLSYVYPDNTTALLDIDLDIAGGDRMALVGHNGAGKTTLIKHLCGLRTPQSGSLLYKERPLTEDRLIQARLQTGLLFQDPDDQLFGHTVIDDAAFGPLNQGLNAAEAQKTAHQALERVGLDHLAYKAPHNLSFGQKKRAALAGLLAMHPHTLILDEPTTNLDPHQEEIFLELLRDFSGTLICISHDLIFLFELCSRAVVLDRGRITHDTTMRRLVGKRASLRDLGLDFSFRFSSGVIGAPEAGNDQPAASPSPAASIPPSDSPPLVQITNMTYTYPDGTQALKEIDLTIHAGERLALIGENGAGKTTLLSCLLGLRRGRGGFSFGGTPLSPKKRPTLWRKVGIVFQDCADQLFCPSVAEEVAFGLKQQKMDKKEIARRVDTALDLVRLRGFEERVPLHLSGGERKRLALASVLAMDPQLLILDEPTAGLDPRGEELLLDILKNLECTLLLVSHDIFIVQELTRRTLIMHSGEIINDLSTSDFLQDPSLADLNGLAYSYRQRSSQAIRRLQHIHEHDHLHRHLHDHPHLHDGYVHSHPHEHVHAHRHLFVHSHQPAEDGHVHHPARSLHEHDHPDHEHEHHEHHHD